jgi:hypothetical protein
MKMKILNSKGSEIILNDREKRVVDVNQRMVNALGYEIDITTLTTIIKKVTEQKFFEIVPSEYMPVKVGEGAWSTNLVTYRSFSLGDDFTNGILNTGADSTRLASADAGVDSVPVIVKNWAKSIGWSLFDLQFAAKSGNWDLVTAKEKARKRNWDLGIQKVAFLGIAGNAGVKGLLNQAGIPFNETVISKALKSMTATELSAFCAAVLDAYRTRCARTAWPTHFVIPESDYLGLAVPSSADFPLKSKLQVLEETFQIMTKNKGFKILPLAYADAAYSGQAYQQYCLYNSEEESLRIDIPVSYTNTLANSIDNFSFQNVGYGQFTGAMAYRPLELMYFKYTPTP